MSDAHWKPKPPIDLHTRLEGRDLDIANAVFANYGIDPVADPCTIKQLLNSTEPLAVDVYCRLVSDLRDYLTMSIFPPRMMQP